MHYCVVFFSCLVSYNIHCRRDRTIRRQVKRGLIEPFLFLKENKVFQKCLQTVHFRKHMSKPNERLCRILPEKISGIPPRCFFVPKLFFFSNFSEKELNFFFNEIDCTKFSKCFSMCLIETLTN